MTPPDLLRVFLEEQPVQHGAEPIDVEIFKRLFVSLFQTGNEVAEPCANRPNGAQRGQCFPFQANRVVKEGTETVDAGHTPADQHDPVFLFRIRSARLQRNRPSQLAVVPGGSALKRQAIPPPGQDPVALAEKPVPADVHAAAPDLHGTGDAADFIGGFQNDDVYRQAILPEQFTGGGKPGRAGADNHHGFHMLFITPRFAVYLI